jgi:hypothetical protein
MFMEPRTPSSPEDQHAEPEDQADEQARLMLEAQEDAAKDRENEGGYQ